MPRKLLLFWLTFFPVLCFAQVTVSNISGSVKTQAGAALQGATITITHIPTGTKTIAVTGKKGNYAAANLQAGGPYIVEVNYVGYETVTKDEIYLQLGETQEVNFVMGDAVNTLRTVTVTSQNRGSRFGSKGGAEAFISRDKMDNLPTVGRNLGDYLRAVPTARLTSAEGGITIAGQNNRYNSFYIDGAVNNDVYGLSNSGTNGGQAGIAPISIDAIDQFQVVISPYDASLGNFTGGGINAVTRSGTNNTQGSVYYYFRNQSLTGKTPTGDKSLATRLSDFKNQTSGFRIGGAFVKNKLFYFLNAELQRDERPQFFDTATYTGFTQPAAILALADTVRKRYGYDAGGFINNAEKVKANRIATKIDWNVNNTNKLSISYRYNKGERTNTNTSSTSAINFYNNGYLFPTTTHSASAELRSITGKASSNRLLLTYTNVVDDRNPIGSPFPKVQIIDGTGTNSSSGIIFGSDNSSAQNLVKQKNYSLFDAYKFIAGKHNFTLGTDDELNDALNVFIQNTYGNYVYNGLTDFYNNAAPRQYSTGYPIIDNKVDDNTKAAATFEILKLSFFANDEYKANENLSLNFALRLDYTKFLTTPATDAFTNDSALPKFAQYYDLQGARSGLKPTIPVSLSPRVGFTYKIPKENVFIRGGAGLFTGRIPLVWPGGIYNNNGLYQGSFTANSGQNAAALDIIRFRNDPVNQWKANEVNISLSKGPLNLISQKFKVPKLFRASLGFDKLLGSGWTVSSELIVSKNINEIYYTNINILPSIANSVAPDTRKVYPSPVTIPIRADGSNPYDNAVLLSNNKGDKGFAYNFTFTIDKRTNTGFVFDATYTYGDSYTVNEGTSSVNYSQWRFMETVNGRNNITRTRSDFSMGNRIFAYASKKFTYAHKKLATTLTVVYTGQSGTPFSYVYSGAAVKDDPIGGNDLIYIPTTTELQNSTFLSNTLNAGTPQEITYTPEQQKAALETYISNNSYLNKHRGSYAQRNASRLPFTNIIDIKLVQNFNLRIGKKRYQFQLTYDVFNFTNFLNRNWGRTWFLNGDSYALISFAGYKSVTDLTPQYRYNPDNNNHTPWGISSSTSPQYIARWTSQLGIRFNFL